jgi:glycosyltransferase involved in cell wall biosynthesis
MNEDVSVAVIIPAYNAAAFIAEAIESVLAQSAPAAQVIVVDDGSTDMTAERCARYGDAVILIEQSNAGVSVARNTGAAQASAGWFVFLDADDRLLPDALERMRARAAASRFGVVYGQSICFDDATGDRWIHGLPSSQGPPPAATLASFWKSAIATPGAAMVRAKLFRDIGGFDARVNTIADRDFWMKAGVLCEFGFVDGPVIEKRLHGTNMCANRDRSLFQAAFVQLEFLIWCQARGIDTAFLGTTRQAIIDNVLRKARETRSLDGIAQIIQLADKRAIRTELVERSRRYEKLTPAAAGLELSVRAGVERLARKFRRAKP